MAPGGVSGGEMHAARKTEVARTEPPAAWPKRQRSVRRVPPTIDIDSALKDHVEFLHASLSVTACRRRQPGNLRRPP